MPDHSPPPHPTSPHPTSPRPTPPGPASQGPAPARPGSLTEPAGATPPYFWGIDVGGTGIKLGLVDDVGRTLAYESLPTREAEGPRAAVRRIAEVIAATESRLGLPQPSRRCGIGAPGPMDLSTGDLIAPPQLPSWANFPLRDAVAEAADRPVSFLNDASAAAYGEYWLGGGRDAGSMVMLTLGTGVGGGIIIEGELVHGTNSFASECGHMIVDPHPTAELCGWGGGRGQLEAYASATGVVRRLRQRLAAGEASRLGGDDPESITAKRVYEAAVDGDDLANSVIDETAIWLGVGVATLVHVIDPGRIVLGGAMNFGGSHCPVGRRFLNGVVEEFRRRTFDNVFAGTQITFAELGSDAGYLGAAGYARREAGRG